MERAEGARRVEASEAERRASGSSRIARLIAVAGLLCSSTAFAQIKQYGNAGTFEVAGMFQLSSVTSDYDDSGKSTESRTTISPTGGFYIMNSVEILGDVRISNAEIKPDEGDSDKANLFSVGAGAGYFLGIGTIRVGPQLLLRYYSNKVEFGGGGEFSDTGPGVTVGVAAKVPIGSGGLLISGLNYDYLNTSRKVTGAGKEDGTVSGYALTVGFGIFF